MYLVNTIEEFPSYAAKRGISLITGVEVPNPAAEVGRIFLDFTAYGIPLTLGNIDDTTPTPIGMAPPAAHEHLTDEAFAAMATAKIDGPHAVGAVDPFLISLLTEIGKRLLSKFGPSVLDWLIPTPKPAA